MKKICMIVFFVFLGSQLIPAQTITVNSPAPGVTWYKGDTKTISWSSSGCSDPNIKINIFRNSIDQANFVEQLTCTGCSSKSWTIPGSYTNGNYQIRVKTADNICVGDSGIFQIADQISNGIISVNSPAPGVTWYKGDTKTISWSSSGCSDPDIKINIFRNSIDQANFVEQLTCMGCSSKSWTIPLNYADGNYQIRVKTEDNACLGDSSVFKIAMKENTDPPDFELTEIITTPGSPDKLHSISLKTRNNGNDYDGPLSFRILGMDKLSGGKFTLDEERTYSMKIKKGETIDKRILSDIGWPVDVCNITFGAVVDPDKKIPETNENNNFIERNRYKGELLGKKYCGIRIIPNMIQIGKASLRSVPHEGSVVLADDKFDLLLTFRNECSETKTIIFSIVYDWTRFLRDGKNKVIWESRITLKPCEVKPLRFTGLKIPKEKEFKVLALREYYNEPGLNPGFGILYKINVSVDY